MLAIDRSLDLEPTFIRAVRFDRLDAIRTVVLSLVGLALQDNLKDVYRALRSLRQARSEEEGLLTEFEQAPE